MEKSITREQEAELRRRFERILKRQAPWTAGEFALARTGVRSATKRQGGQRALAGSGP